MTPVDSCIIVISNYGIDTLVIFINSPFQGDWLYIFCWWRIFGRIKINFLGTSNKVLLSTSESVQILVPSIIYFYYSNDINDYEKLDISI